MSYTITRVDRVTRDLPIKKLTCYKVVVVRMSSHLCSHNSLSLGDEIAFAARTITKPTMPLVSLQPGDNAVVPTAGAFRTTSTRRIFVVVIQHRELRGHRGLAAAANTRKCQQISAVHFASKDIVRTCYSSLISEVDIYVLLLRA